MKRQLRKKLLALKAKDQSMRHRGKWDISIDRNNVAELKKIIADSGWPKMSDVGPEGSDAAWLIAQHADFDHKFQALALRSIKELSLQEEAPLHQIAYLSDRISVNRGGKQTFGTQFYKTKSGVLKLRPTKNLRGLDKKRKKFRLPPLALYSAALKKFRKK